MVFGTFDGVHEGHLDFFRQAKKLGDYLVVIIARDENILRIKKHLPERGERQRLSDMRKVRMANEVMLGDKKDPFRLIKKIKPDMICLGYDQKAYTKNLKEELKKRGLNSQIFRAKAYKPKKLHSSLLNKK